MWKIQENKHIPEFAEFIELNENSALFRKNCNIENCLTFFQNLAAPIGYYLYEQQTKKQKITVAHGRKYSRQPSPVPTLFVCAYGWRLPF